MRESSDENQQFSTRVLRKTYVQYPAELEITPCREVRLFVRNENLAVYVGGADVADAGEDGKLRRALHGHDLSADSFEDLIVLRNFALEPQVKSMAFPYTFKTNDVVPKTLSDLQRVGFYPWDTRAMVPLFKTKTNTTTEPKAPTNDKEAAKEPKTPSKEKNI